MTTVEGPRFQEYMPLKSLKGNVDNPKEHDIDGLRESMQRLGYIEAIAIDERTGLLISGHGRVETLRDEQLLGAQPPEGIVDRDGDWWVPVQRGWGSKDDDDARAALIGLNQLVLSGGFKPTPLANLLQQLDATPTGLVGTGFKPDALRSLLATLNPPRDAPADADDFDEAEPSEPITRPGDVWQLGPHRVICGDSRVEATWQTLVGDDRVAVVVTSPPYAQQRDYDASSGFRPVPPEEYSEWFEPVQRFARSVLADDGSYFLNIKEHSDEGQRSLYVKDLTIAHVREWGWLFVDEFAWTKPGVPAKYPNRFKNGWEPVFHFSVNRAIKFRPEAVGHESADVVKYDRNNPPPLTHSGFLSGSTKTGRQDGIALPNNVLKLSSARADKERGHQAEFPVSLPFWFIRAFSDSGDLVLDPFCGAGTTIIAAHEAGRVGLGIEISPAYCDIICRRFQKRAGVKPVRAGEPVDFMTT